MEYGGIGNLIGGAVGTVGWCSRKSPVFCQADEFYVVCNDSSNLYHCIYRRIWQISVQQEA